jgi:hypothetical protein
MNEAEHEAIPWTQQSSLRGYPAGMISSDQPETTSLESTGPLPHSSAGMALVCRREMEFAVSYVT